MPSLAVRFCRRGSFGTPKSGLDKPYSAADRPETGDRFGSALTTGDFNGDGYTDLAVRASGEEIRGLLQAARCHRDFTVQALAFPKPPSSASSGARPPRASLTWLNPASLRRLAGGGRLQRRRLRRPCRRRRPRRRPSERGGDRGRSGQRDLRFAHGLNRDGDPQPVLAPECPGRGGPDRVR